MTLATIEKTKTRLTDKATKLHWLYEITYTDSGKKVLDLCEHVSRLKYEVDRLFRDVAKAKSWTENTKNTARRLGEIPIIEVDGRFTAIWPGKWNIAIHGNLAAYTEQLPETCLADVPVSVAVGASWKGHSTAPSNFQQWKQKHDDATLNYASWDYSTCWVYRGLMVFAAGEGKNRIELYRQMKEPMIRTQLRIHESVPPEELSLRRSLYGGLWFLERKDRPNKGDHDFNEIANGRYLLLWPEYSVPILKAYGVKERRLPIICLRPEQTRKSVFSKLAREFCRQ